MRGNHWRFGVDCCGEIRRGWLQEKRATDYRHCVTAIDSEIERKH